MSKGAYAKGTLPGAKELMEHEKAYRAREGLIKRRQEEIQRLRAALKLITTAVEDIVQ